MMPAARSRAVGLVMGVADAEWLAGVEDREGTPGIDRIMHYIADGLGWKHKYRRDGDFLWCGAFAAECWRAAGLHPVLRRECFASTYRLWCYGRRQGEFHPWTRVRLAPDEPTISLRLWWEEVSAARGEDCRRLMQRCAPGRPLEWEPMAGDIALVGRDPKEFPTTPAFPHPPEWGEHVVLVRGYDATAGLLETVEGNAIGLGPPEEGHPEGRRYEGVVRCVRPLPGANKHSVYHVRYILRPGLADCQPGVEYLA